MNYVIQNFYYPANTIRINTRSKSVLLARNFGLIYVLFSNSTKAYTLALTSAPFTKYAFLISGSSFDAFAKTLFKRTKLIKYTPVGVNFPISAHYLALYNLNSFLGDDNTLLTSFNATRRAFTYPYFEGSQLVITPVAKSPLSYALYKLLRMNLNLWFYWPKKFAITTHYTPLAST